MSKTEYPGWWCETHKRWATHADDKGNLCCDPALPGILMPCRISHQGVILNTPDPDPDFVPTEFRATLGVPDSFRTFRCGSEVRWLRPPHIFGLSILQQAWACVETGEVEWRDVPTAPVEPDPDQKAFEWSDIPTPP
jgi:hypothetical protein